MLDSDQLITEESADCLFASSYIIVEHMYTHWLIVEINQS